MALRIRQDGRILCAAMFAAEPGDVYIDDAAHYVIAVELLALQALAHGEWRFVEQGTRRFENDSPEHTCTCHGAEVLAWHIGRRTPEEALEHLRTMGVDEFKRSLVKAGSHTEDGKLIPELRGEGKKGCGTCGVQHGLACAPWCGAGHPGSR